jgi:CMP-N,N'-diacetyllegionaminic acid synthase
MKIVSVILARGGSKGIPRKNLINLQGFPLISYTIKESIKSNVNETWVSTEDNEIKTISKKYGANVIDRPFKFSTDTSQSEEALIHFAQNIESDFIVFIQPTSPLLDSKYINKGLDMMKKYDSVFSAYKEHWQPRWTKNNKPYKWDISKRPRRQDKEELFVENGAFYINSRNSILKNKLRYSGNIGIVEMPLYESFQVDELNDLTLINKILHYDKL